MPQSFFDKFKYKLKRIDIKLFGRYDDEEYKNHRLIWRGEINSQKFDNLRKRGSPTGQLQANVRRSPDELRTLLSILSKPPEQQRAEEGVRIRRTQDYIRTEPQHPAYPTFGNWIDPSIGRKHMISVITSNGVFTDQLTLYTSTPATIHNYFMPDGCRVNHISYEQAVSYHGHVCENNIQHRNINGVRNNRTTISSSLIFKRSTVKHIDLNWPIPSSGQVVSIYDENHVKMCEDIAIRNGILHQFRMPNGWYVVHTDQQHAVEYCNRLIRARNVDLRRNGMSEITEIDIPQYNHNQNIVDDSFLVTDAPLITNHNNEPAIIERNRRVIDQSVNVTADGEHNNSRHFSKQYVISNYLKLLHDFGDKTEDEISLIEEIIMTTKDKEELDRNITATKLLKQWLTTEEWLQLMTDHKIKIKSKKRPHIIYEVVEDPYDRVREIDEREPNKHVKYCGYVADTSLSAADRLLAKIMSIKTDEDYFLEHSNKSSF